MAGNFYANVIRGDARFNSNQCISDILLLEPNVRAKVAAIVADAKANSWPMFAAENR